MYLVALLKKIVCLLLCSHVHFFLEHFYFPNKQFLENTF